jgi:light-regulated signal transduction histidine kinase (bacteriophytochrome)
MVQRDKKTPAIPDKRVEDLEDTQMATLNILEDFNEEKRRLEDTQRAILNILDDLNQSREELQKAHDVLEVRVKERTAELARSNAELEQFAYIASHDLQEPLRMVSSYVQLLEKRYKGKLDQDADDFIGFAADGALRMQRLINDLLAYSRVGTRGKSFGTFSLEAALAQAVENLQVAIKENKATVTQDPLPMAYGDIGQVTQVFQNLIDNAIKFHREEPPKVHVSARIEGNNCICTIQDNGIGIAPEFINRLFTLFQRLHTRKDYPGTGLGLAICKRIVERHGGRIWVESVPDKGSTFYFTIPTTQRSYYNG